MAAVFDRFETQGAKMGGKAWAEVDFGELKAKVAGTRRLPVNEALLLLILVIRQKRQVAAARAEAAK